MANRHSHRQESTWNEKLPHKVLIAGCGWLDPTKLSLDNAGMSNSIYLDHNSTTPLLPEVADAIRETSLKYSANPASQHRAGQEARRVLERARERISELLGAKIVGPDADHLIFTSGGTEANNLTIFGMLAPAPGSLGTPPGHIVCSAIEHPAVMEPVGYLEQQGWSVSRVAPNTTGAVDPRAIVAAIQPATRLVCLMAANNETGVVQPVEPVAQACRERGIPLLVDAAQWVGKLPLMASNWEAAALTCAPHKFGGPGGIGLLLLRHDVALRPLVFGGHQQAGLRPGTEVLALAVGAQVALEHAMHNLHSEQQRIAALRDEFEKQMLQEIPEAVVIGAGAPRLPNTSNIAFPEIDRQSFFLALDMAGVACSTGSACASGSSEPSPVLVAMGLEKSHIGGSLRFSLGHTTTADEITAAVQRILKCHKHLRSATKC